MGVSNSLIDLASLLHLTFIPPQTDKEMLNNKPVPSMKVHTSSSVFELVARGISLVQYTNNPHDQEELVFY